MVIDDFLSDKPVDPVSFYSGDGMFNVIVSPKDIQKWSDWFKKQPLTISLTADDNYSILYFIPVSLPGTSDNSTAITKLTKT